MKISALIIRLGFPFLALLLGGCAMGVKYAPSEILPRSAATSQTPRTIARQAEIQLDTGYFRSLKAGSQWIQVGTIPEGDVYKAHKSVFTLEGAHVHEAYLVVASDRLVGFYLPVERGFSRLTRQTNLIFN